MEGTEGQKGREGKGRKERTGKGKENKSKKGEGKYSKYMYDRTPEILTSTSLLLSNYGIFTPNIPALLHSPVSDNHHHYISNI